MPARRELLGAQREVELDLVFDLALPPVAPAHARSNPRRMPSRITAPATPSSAADVRIVVTVSAYFIQLLVSAAQDAFVPPR